MPNTETLRLTNYCVDPASGDYFTPGIYPPGTLPTSMLNAKGVKLEPVDTQPSKDENRVVETNTTLTQKNPLVVKDTEPQPPQTTIDLNPDSSGVKKVKTKVSE